MNVINSQLIGGLIPSIELDRSSARGGTQKLTMANNVAQGSPQVCKSCLIHCPDTNDFLIPKGVVILAPVDNVGGLHFYGTSNDDVVHIWWRK